MSQTSCERRSFPVPMRWLHAGSDLSRPDHGHQCAERPLMRSERAPKCLLHAPDLACLQTSQARSPAGVTPTIEIGANIKSP